MRFVLAAVGATALMLAGCAGSSMGPSWQQASNRHHHHHGVHSVWRTATVGRSSTGEGGSTGLASFYRASRTASGEQSTSDLTAAHPNLPFGTRVRVTNLSNQRSVTVRINDRGPFVTNRSIDLSYGAASAIGMTGAGVARVRMEVLQ